MQLINRTPFKGAVFVDLDAQGVEHAVLAVKATFDFGDSEHVQLSAAQADLVFQDVYAGKPGASSLLYESDANWGRLATDVSLLAHGYPARAGDRSALVAMRVGAVTRMAQVFGERRWTSTLGVSRLEGPQPFERVPLVYEQAFGGVDASGPAPTDAEAERRNPVGRGLVARRSRLSASDVPVPAIEDPDQPITRPEDRPAPVGFVCVDKGWWPRATFAGTYDEAWQAHRMPLLPLDFDARFHTSASAGLTLPGVTGGEQVDLVNLTPARQARFHLPRVTLQAAMHIDAAPQAMPLKASAVVINAMKSTLTLVWHAALPVHGIVDDVRWILLEGRIDHG